jgi:hypothetical protein
MYQEEDDYQAFATRYNTVPGYPNCFYDTQDKTHVWTLIDTKTKQWVGSVKGYGKNNCLAAYADFKSRSSSIRAPKNVPAKEINPVSKRRQISANCFLKDNDTTICWESPPGSGVLSCSKGKELANFFGHPVVYDKIPGNASSCQAIRGKWCKEKTANNCGGGAGSAGGAPPDTSTDADCNPWGLLKGFCVAGKSILKGGEGVAGAAGEWAGSPVAQFMPVILVGGGIMLLAIMMKGR